MFIVENNLPPRIGEYRLVVTSMTPAPSFTGSGNIVKITFNPLNLGNSALSLQSQLYDYPPTGRDPRISLPIQRTAQNSYVTVTESNSTSSPTPSASGVKSTPTPTSPSTSPTSLPTLEPAELEIGPELVFAVALLLLLPVIIVLVLIRKRK